MAGSLAKATTPRLALPSATITCRWRPTQRLPADSKCADAAASAVRKVAPASRRGLPRRDLELAGDVAALLGEAAEAVGIALHFVDMGVAFLMQRPEQFAHALEQRGEIGRLLVLGVGALADMNVEPEAGKALLGERSAAGEPVGSIDRFDDDGGDLGILAQDSRGEIADGGGN